MMMNSDCTSAPTVLKGNHMNDIYPVKIVAIIILLILSLYLSFGGLILSGRHPELTRVQVFQHIIGWADHVGKAD